jgi:amidophosphoribosyltransferase
MCGILGVVATSPVNQLLYDGLHGAAAPRPGCGGHRHGGGQYLHMHKGNPGLVRDVFRTRNMRALPGNWGIGHVRYPTAGSAYNFAEAQPFYVNSPFGIVLGHNGNLTNAEQLKGEMFRLDRRHINTNSDSEVCSTCWRTSCSRPRKATSSTSTASSRPSPGCIAAAAAPTPWWR